MSPPTSTRSTLAEALRGWPPPPLDPAGPHAGAVAALSWALFGMFVAVLLVVVAALLVALFGKPAWRRRLAREKAIWIGGLAFPVVVLTALLVWGLTLTRDLTAAPQPGEMRVRVTGEMWWWRVVYLDGEGRAAILDANELHIPAGTPVTLELEAADVIHSFWIPRLAGKLDMIPGRRNILRIQADSPGVYAGQCAEYCGGPHALMGFVVVAHAPAEFERWRAERLAPPAPPPDAFAARGAQLFETAGCGACHRVRGTGAEGLAGPDLSHVGARRSLGAGILPNNHGALAGWIADSQAIKPGNRMPPYRVLSGEELRALAAWLGSRR
ncbi:MAG: cytochrome c oxidase subunit II [Phenylobacterium sp.]|jgi:cytochrome c oxidase subunit 2|uniref:cytochrome c oxidase subunit II n=1 Tax=Phenylobacterium sp. TaxID=1871053 RepID=UPI002A2D18DD|nr:cytochrome c oxidase subunit II [Phenylobacterium sp.]MDD3837075.1 cytochrome c oxidase subunit II [Phenylobacterium sp.]MDX9996369.1 cytochrome c oxidase subunit II [Phenylobacterium sp.]